MTGLIRVPAGRAGRLWLRHRLDVAHRGAGLLDQKLRILHAERQRFALLADRTGRAWDEAAREARTWLLRAVLLAGERGVRLARLDSPAAVEVVWTQSMGVRHPAEASCTVPAPDPSAPLRGNTALVRAAEAHRVALQAAVQHAVARAALAVVESEEEATRRRLRAIENRRVPRLEEALARVQLGLEEREHAEAVRLRWARERRPGPTARDAGEETP